MRKSYGIMDCFVAVAPRNDEEAIDCFVAPFRAMTGLCGLLRRHCDKVSSL